MRFSTIIACALSAFVASVHAHNNGTATNGTATNGTATIVTEVVTKYTTYCPFPTTIVENNHTYTVTEATTLTISNCPCTRTKTYTTVTSSICKGGCSTGTAAFPASTGPTYSNGTTTGKPTASVPASNGTTPASTSSIPAFETGSASRASVAAGALAGLIGVAAYLL